MPENEPAASAASSVPDAALPPVPAWPVRVWRFGRYPVATALFLLLAFPRFDLWPMAHLALVPLLLHLYGCRRGRAAFGAGLLSGCLFYAGLLYWIPRSLGAYGGLNLTMSILTLLAVCLACGGFWGAFAWAVYRLVSRWGWRGFFPVPCLWVVMEWLRDSVPQIGFPWGNLGTSQAYVGPLIQIADLTGVYGVSGLVAAINTVFLLLLLMEVPRKVKIFWGALVGIALFHVLVYAEFCYLTIPITRGRAVEVAGIQGNAPDQNDWERLREFHVEIYPALVAELDKRSPRPELVILPENPAPFSYDRDLGYRQMMSELSRRHGITLLFNGIHYSARGYHNSVFSLDPAGRPGPVYDKIRLVPFAEQIPLQPVFSFVRILSREISNFRPGTEPVLHDARGVKAGVFICYEGVFPGLVRDFTGAGADLLVNVTNDGWFGQTAAPYQHFQPNLLRAVENRRYLVRVANTGISAIIDPFGRVVEKGPLFERAIVSGTVYTQDRRSLYVAWGNWFPVLCAGAALFFLILSTRKKQDGTGA